MQSVVPRGPSLTCWPFVPVMFPATKSAFFYRISASFVQSISYLLAFCTCDVSSNKEYAFHNRVFAFFVHSISYLLAFRPCNVSSNRVRLSQLRFRLLHFSLSLTCWPFAPAMFPATESAFHNCVSPSSSSPSLTCCPFASAIFPSLQQCNMSKSKLNVRKKNCH